MELSKTNELQIWFNGSYVSRSQPILKAGDLGLHRGYGVFDFFRFVGSQPFLWDHYFERFKASAKGLGLEITYSVEDLKKICSQLATWQRSDSVGIKMTLTGGYSVDGYTPENSNLIITPHILSPPSGDKYREGFKVITHEYQREMPHIKTINYLRGIKLLPDLQVAGADDVLYHNKGIITEFPRSNFFMVRQGRVMTPGNNILSGITRKSVLSLLQVEERELDLDLLAQAQEAFLTSTTKGIMPVTQINGRVLNHGGPGPMTRKLMQAFSQLQDQCPPAIP
ncbi:MAG: aminotransferase class IV [Cyclobacteriaceae bacterium]|nr:aminotransferase class IV [Cyclobacteriaceae bacterium]